MTIEPAHYPLLMKVNSPDDLRLLSEPQLEQICQELRQYLLASVSRSSGHLASGLGTVELTVALHYVFNTPFDRLLWDVGHQAYPHKIITGRRDRMETIKKKDGLHPFPWRNESEYDHFNVGHSSTTISAALGMAIAAQKEQKNRKVVSIIGDGAITAGMAFEALNHAGDVHPDMLVVLNDNEMSISENVGALNNHFARLLSGSFYSTIRESSKIVLSGIPPIKELAKRTEEHLKGMVVPGTIFEELGFNYIGPIDGHDVEALVDTLSNMRQLKGPQLLHIKTTKGKGYEPAEKDPIGYHAVPQFDPSDQQLPSSKPGLPTYSKVFGDWLCDMATEDPKLMAITPAMREGSGMVRFSKEFPEQYFDVAIAEQHAVTLAAGLSCEGLNPVVAIYSTFLQRGYDQVIHDVAIQDQPVLFAIDRAGVVGSDGPTHQGAFDISFLRCIPKMVIMVPSDEAECRNMLFTGHTLDKPAAVRYPRGKGTGADISGPMQRIEIGQSNTVRQSTAQKVAILCFGPLLHECVSVAEAIDATLVDMRFAKPIDEARVAELAQSHDVLVTVEDHAIKGGAGSAVIEYLMANKMPKPVLNLGLPDVFIKHGEQAEILAELGLDSSGIQTSIEAYINT
ncbi:1-deoxy-D-xylulose-5-phosphate synthase [Echinimonas agarilytica]|uniref:1-deoxy-D-xylulose-5-phosphate synthase n=1 Tax=Echinimonas agarilytica TaxID=1215918 RepID=A0AA42B8H2_9GAMM|nr:1-deoxy-D-xylulose-5-phosphate synthase [Echinimonas agarilytica]MCM2680543.1 1-deoxy-D-xylulose-5-phosphate synthase [Echinimonas agarilytica]